MIDVILVKSAKGLFPDKALIDIISKAKTQLNERHLNKPYELTGIFLSSYNHQVYREEHEQALKKLKSEFELSLVGGSVVEQLIDSQENKEDSFVLLLLITDGHECKIQTGCVRGVLGKDKDIEDNEDNIEDNVVEAFKESRKQLNYKEEKLCIIFPAFQNNKNLQIESQPNRKGIISYMKQAGLSNKCKIVGGVCTDYWGNFKRKSGAPQLQKSYQYVGEKVIQDGMPYLIFTGSHFDFSFGYGCRWENSPLGKPYPAIISCKESKIDFINSEEPRKFLAKQNHPFALPKEHKEWSRYVFRPLKLRYKNSRTFQMVDLLPSKNEDKSINFFGPCPEKKKDTEITVQLTDEPDITEITQGTDESIEQAIARTENFSPALVILFSCCTRNAFLGENDLFNYEHFAAKKRYREKYQRDIPILVLYMFAEIGPQNEGSPTRQNSSSVVTLTIGEKQSEHDNRYQLDKNLSDFAVKALGLMLKELKDSKEPQNRRLPTTWCNDSRYVEARLIKWLEKELQLDATNTDTNLKPTITKYLKILKDKA